MKKTFLNFGLFLALGLTTVVFNSCDKDDDNDGDTNGGNALKITATNVINDPTNIKTVKAIIYWESGENDYDEDAIAQAPYENNGFTLELPTTLGAKYLEIDAYDLEGIVVSDKNFKSYYLDDLRAYNEDDDEIGYFYLEEENGDNFYYTSWFYSDRDVTMEGEHNGRKYNVTLKKGWNVVYDSYTDDGFSLTSQKPSGVNYTWNYYDISTRFRSASIETKSVENTKSAFSKLKESRKKR